VSELRDLIRTVPGYPRPGIMFRDITTLLADADGFRRMVDAFAERYAGERIGKVAGIEARGFILAGAIAHRLGTGFVPVRKKGKLPWRVVGHDYALEYGVDRVEMHLDAVARDERVLLVDDLIATGGTATAAIHLIEEMGGRIVEACFAIDLPELGGRRRLEERGHRVFALMDFEGE
jgi:adenine phosphoribosyltransferase